MKNKKLHIMKKKKGTLRQRLKKMGYIVTNDTIFDRHLIIDVKGNKHGYMDVKMGWEFLRKLKG